MTKILKDELARAIEEAGLPSAALPESMDVLSPEFYEFWAKMGASWEIDADGVRLSAGTPWAVSVFFTTDGARAFGVRYVELAKDDHDGMEEDTLAIQSKLKRTLISLGAGKIHEGSEFEARAMAEEFGEDLSEHDGHRKTIGMIGVEGGMELRVGIASPATPITIDDFGKGKEKMT